MASWQRKDRLDLTAQKFGRWEVLSEAESQIAPKGHKRRMWNVKCECGTLNKISTSHLRSGLSLGCRNHKLGLKHNKPRIYKNRNPFPYNITAVFNRYKRQAKVRNLYFELTFEQFYKLSQENCYYCNIAPSNINTPSKTPQHYHFGSMLKDFIYSGIDRVDNNKGYLIDNVVACCSKCNRAKLDIPREEFLEWVGRVYKQSIAKGFGGS